MHRPSDAVLLRCATPQHAYMRLTGGALVREDLRSRVDVARQEHLHLLAGDHSNKFSCGVPAYLEGSDYGSLAGSSPAQTLFASFVLAALSASHIGLIHFHDPARSLPSSNVLQSRWFICQAGFLGDTLVTGQFDA